ncbi:hypothetical protein PMAYCL1PPCAC_32749, partial [Pristionchus mayeri]
QTQPVLSLADTIKLRKRCVSKPARYEQPIEKQKKRIGHKKEKQVKSRNGATAKVRSLGGMESWSHSESGRSVFGSGRKKIKLESASEEERSDEEYGPTMTSRSAARERKRVSWEDDHKDEDDEEGMESGRKEKKRVDRRPSAVSIPMKKAGVKRRIERDSDDSEESDEESCSNKPPKGKRGRPRKIERSKGGKMRDRRGGRGMREDESDGEESGDSEVPLAVRKRSAEIVKMMHEAKRANLRPPRGWTKSVPADKEYAGIQYVCDKKYSVEETYKLKNFCRFDYDKLKVGSEVYMQYEKYFYVARIVCFAPNILLCNSGIEFHNYEALRKKKVAEMKREEAEKRRKEERESDADSDEEEESVSEEDEEESEEGEESEERDVSMRNGWRRVKKAEKRERGSESDEEEESEEEEESGEEQESEEEEESVPMSSGRGRVKKEEALSDGSDEEKAAAAADFLMGDYAVDAVPESHEGGGDDLRPDTLGQDTEKKEQEMRDRKEKIWKIHEERREKR